MATTTRKPRQPKVYPDEQKVDGEIKAIQTKVEKQKNQEATEAQKTELKELRAKLGGLRFTRIAKQRTSKIVIGLRNLSKLGSGQYHRTPEQVEKLTKLLNDEVKAAMASLTATKKGEKVTVEIDL